MPMKCISAGAFLAAFSVLAGAFGTHALQGKIGYDLFDLFKTGTQYLTLHSLGLILYGLFKPEKVWPALAFVAGMVLFTGSLYGITFTAIRSLGMITPFGGLLFIAGWIGFALEARKRMS
jgi:uncharacterized membrane protein YgdD (TMEM256/DUF423 family)